MSMKNPLTPAGFEPATFRFVAQHLNHCATAVAVISLTCFDPFYMVIPRKRFLGLLGRQNMQFQAEQNV